MRRVNRCRDLKPPVCPLASKLVLANAKQPPSACRLDSPPRHETPRLRHTKLHESSALACDALLRGSPISAFPAESGIGMKREGNFSCLLVSALGAAFVSWSRNKPEGRMRRFALAMPPGIMTKANRRIPIAPAIVAPPRFRGRAQAQNPRSSCAKRP